MNAKKKRHRRATARRCRLIRENIGDEFQFEQTRESLDRWQTHSTYCCLSGVVENFTSMTNMRL